VIEAPAGADAAAIAQRLGARLVLVSTQAAAVPGGATVILNRQRTPGALALAEDRLLAAPTVGRLIEASGAQVLSRSEEGDAAICEHLVVAAISHDAADAYYQRFPRRAVVCRAERVDLAMAAMLTGSDVLVLTGGAEPSPYLLDRAAATRSTTLLLAPERTVETVRDIEGLFGSSPFSHEAKVERAGALLAAAVDDATLASLAG
ncbi:MAG: DRTGG domain-containing protein, partial [Dehalococcoidia bacterium]|nr:DRTGG domain-containing protein [Dehalococcoidia bacterium]